MLDADGRRVHFAAVSAVKAMRRSAESPAWYIALDDRQYAVFKQVRRPHAAIETALLTA